MVRKENCWSEKTKCRRTTISIKPVIKIEYVSKTKDELKVNDELIIFEATNIKLLKTYVSSSF